MPQTIKLALLDDYQKVAMRMADWDRLKKRGVDITVFHEPFSSVEDAAHRLAPFQVLTLDCVPVEAATASKSPIAATTAGPALSAPASFVSASPSRGLRKAISIAIDRG